MLRRFTICSANLTIFPLLCILERCDVLEWGCMLKRSCWSHLRDSNRKSWEGTSRRTLCNSFHQRTFMCMVTLLYFDNFCNKFAPFKLSLGELLYLFCKCCNMILGLVQLGSYFTLVALTLVLPGYPCHRLTPHGLLQSFLRSPNLPLH